MERWAEQVAAEAGFTAVDHTVELFGLCPECSRIGSAAGLPGRMSKSGRAAARERIRLERRARRPPPPAQPGPASWSAARWARS